MQLLHLYDSNRITLPPCLEDSRKHCTNIFKSFLAQKAQPQNKKKHFGSLCSECFIKLKDTRPQNYLFKSGKAFLKYYLQLPSTLMTNLTSVHLKAHHAKSPTSLTLNWERMDLPLNPVSVHVS